MKKVGEVQRSKVMNSLKGQKKQIDDEQKGPQDRALGNTGSDRG